MESAETKLCPKTEAIFALLARKWTGLILLSLANGERRFNELARAVPGLSARLLSQRARELEEAGLVSRKVLSGSSPIRVSYGLTERGRGLAAILADIGAWASAIRPSPSGREA